MTSTATAAGPEPAPPTLPEPAPPTLLYLMKQVELAVRARLDELMRPAGLTALQYTALTALERHPDLTSARLARHSFVTAQTMSDMVTALRDRGLIERHRDPADRRRLVLALTARGQELLEEYRPAVTGLEAEMLSGMTTAEASQLRQAMLACRDALTGGAGERDRALLSVRQGQR